MSNGSVISSVYDEVSGAITFRVVGAGSTTLRLSTLSPEVKARAVIHGLTQRVSDRAAKGRNPDTGKPAPPADRLAAMANLVDHLNGGGDWEMGRGGPTGPRFDQVVIAALAEVMGKPKDVILAFIAAGAAKHGVPPQAYLARLASGAKVQPVVDRLRAAEATEVDADAELEGWASAEAEGGDEGNENVL